MDVAIGPSTQKEIPRPCRERPTTKLKTQDFWCFKAWGRVAFPVPGWQAQAGTLPVKGGTAHRVHRATMGREGELHWGPQWHRAGHPSEGNCL